MLPSWIQEANWILQTTDPDRKPKEPTPPEIIDAFEVAKRLEYDDRAVIDLARGAGFPAAVRFEDRRIVGGIIRDPLAASIPFYNWSAVQAWRAHLARLIKATLR
jgi:hypothetical protein